nr:glycosyltransferase [Pedobacter sp. ASV2]
MKVIQISASYKPAYIYGGPIMSVAKLCEELAKNSDIELEVFTTTANGKNELSVAPNKPVIVDGVKVRYFKRITKDHTHFSPTLLKALKKEILDCRAINKKLIIHIHAWWNLVSILSCWLAKWYNVPVVLSPRGMLTNYSLNNRNNLPKKLVHNLKGKSLLKYCYMHATSKKEKEDIIGFIQPIGIEVIYNLVSMPESALADTETNSTPIFKLIFLSRIEEKKGLELIFKALSNLTINWVLTIAGAGKTEYIEHLKAYAVSLNIEKKLNWVGQISNEDKFNLFKSNDLMVLTSYNENFANVVIESLSVGTAVLISEEVGLADYLKSNELGWVASLNVEAIKSRINEAFNMHQKRLEIREKAPEKIKRDFNSTLLAKKYINLYRKLIS